LKKLIFFVSAVLGCCIFVFWYIEKNPSIEVNDRIITKVASGMDLDSYSIFPPAKFANIQGEVLNISDEPLSNVYLVYSIGQDTLNIFIPYINAGDRVSFTSEEIKVNSSSPSYSFLEMRLRD
jgi:hypothetical protein